MISQLLSKNVALESKLFRGFLALLAFSFFSSPAIAELNGKLVIVGGALSNDQDDIFEALLQSETPRSELKAAVIPAASGKPSKYGNAFRETLIRRGLKEENIRLLELAMVDDSSTDEIDESLWIENGNDQAIVDWLNQCDLVWFTGGDQSRITGILNPDGEATKVYVALQELLECGGTIGGTSAGAAMMSQAMIVGGSSTGALLSGMSSSDDINQEDGPLLLGEGLGFFKHGIIDQHFDAKARLGRLIIATAREDEPTYGFGIDENTALAVDLETGIATVAGASQVIVVNGAKMETASKPIHLENIRISSLGPGDSIALDSKTITPSDDKSATTDYEYYDISSPVASGIMSGYGSLNMLLTRLLVDNKSSESATSYLFSENHEFGYRLNFTQDEKSRGYWTYREGQVDHYTVIDALLSIEPIKVSVQSL